jgi:hypothetical protein
LPRLKSATSKVFSVLRNTLLTSSGVKKSTISERFCELKITALTKKFLKNTHCNSRVKNRF